MPFSLITLVASFSAGILAWHLSPFLRILPALVFVVLTGCFCFIRPAVGRTPRAFVLSLAVFLLGFGYAELRRPAAAAPIPPEESQWDGRVASTPDTGEDRIRFLIETHDIGKVRVTTGPESEAAYGDLVRVRGKIKPLGGFRNPGLPDFSERLRREGVTYRIWSESIEILEKNPGWIGRLQRLRNELRKSLASLFSRETALFLSSIVLGFSEMEDSLRDAFARSGTAHILSVSGSHLSLLSVVLTLLIRSLVLHLPASWYLPISQRITATGLAFALSIPAIVLYSLISGARIPTVRSLLMTLTLIGAVLLGRRHHWSGAVALAAGLILLFHPWALFDMSFQLSFAAVFAIARLGRLKTFPPDERNPAEPDSLRRKTWRYVQGLLLASLAAWIGTAPISAWYFQNVSLVAPLANLLVVPLAGFVLVPLGLLHASLVAFHADATLLANLLEWCTGILLGLVRFFASLPLAWLSVSSPPVWLLIVLLLVPYLPFRLWVRSVLWGAVAVLALFPSRPTGFEVAMLDVGQGESIMIRLPDRTYLVDTAGMEGFDVGGRIVAPFLLNRGVRKLDAVILSHTHPDHMGGLEALLSRIPVEEILWNGHPSEWLKAIQEDHPGLRLRRLSADDSFHGPDFQMEILHPDREFLERYPPETRIGRNNDSLVIHLRAGEHTFLLTGDIRAEAENWLVNKNPARLKAEVFKVPHHGGKGTATDAFLGAVSPWIALISAGPGNRYGHPRPEVLERLEAAGSEVYRTDENGGVIIDDQEGRLRVRTDRDFRMKSWSTPSDEWPNLLVLLGFVH